MSRFPFFKEINRMRALVVGGGTVALRRAAVLVNFGANVTCIAPEFCEGFSALNAECIQKQFELTDFFDFDIVIAATDNRALNKAISDFVKSQGGEVNVADDPESSTFHFPAIVNRGGMTVAISSNSSSPSAAKFIRERIEEAIPENFETVLQSMEAARRWAKEMIPDQKMRARILRAIFDSCLNAEIQPDSNELKSMIRELDKE